MISLEDEKDVQIWCDYQEEKQQTSADFFLRLRFANFDIFLLNVSNYDYGDGSGDGYGYGYGLNDGEGGWDGNGDGACGPISGWGDGNGYGSGDGNGRGGFGANTLL